MSSAEDYVKQIDPVVDLSRPIKLRIEEGASNVTQTKYPAASLSVQNIQFNNINPPSADTVIDKKVQVRAGLRLTFTGTNVPTGQFLLSTDGLGEYGTPQSGGLAGGVDGLRAFPLTQIMSSIDVKLNSQTFTQNVNRYIEPLLRYSSYRDVAEKNWSMTPTMQDTYQNYSDFVTYGSSKNVLANYGEDGYETPRAGFSGLIVVSQNIVGSPDGTASAGLGSIMEAIVDVEITEPLFISPLGFGAKDGRGLVGIKTMAVTMNVDSQYADYVWSHDAVSSGKTISNIALSYDVSSQGYPARPEIMFTYLTPRPGAIIPIDNKYAYHSITDYTYSLTSTIGAGNTAFVQVNNIQLDSIPKRVFIFLRKQASDKTFNDTDSYARIQNINATFANKSGILSDANEQQLYQMSVRNGLKMSWSEWSKQVGSVMCLDFARQVSLNDMDVVGKNGSYQLQYKLGIKNIASAGIIFDVHTVVVNEGYIDIRDQSIDRHDNLGAIDRFYNSPLIHEIDWEDFEDFYGSGFADRLKSLAKKLAPKAKELLSKGKDMAVSAAKKYGPELANLALSEIPMVGPEIGQVAEMGLRALASGEITGAEYDKRMCAAYESYGMGGKPASKATMKKKLKRY